MLQPDHDTNGLPENSKCPSMCVFTTHSDSESSILTHTVVLPQACLQFLEVIRGCMISCNVVVQLRPKKLCILGPAISLEPHSLESHRAIRMHNSLLQAMHVRIFEGRHKEWSARQARSYRHTTKAALEGTEGAQITIFWSSRSQHVRDVSTLMVVAAHLM